MSAARNPKDLKEMIEASNGDMADMQANLAKLKGLTEDDKSENALLRSRIEEQSQLIMILKQRTDEVTVRCRTLDRINKELEEFRDNTVEEFTMQTKKYNMLDARFGDLAYNHEEMIKIKDDYKNRNKALMKENAQLVQDNERLFSKAIEERDNKIAEMDKKFSYLRDKSSTLDLRNKELEQHAKVSEERHRKESQDLKTRLSEAEERLKAASAKLKHQTDSSQQTDAQSQHKLQALTKEKDELLQLAMSRGKLIQETQTENKKLQQKIGEMEKAVKNMQEKFERDVVAVNVNLQVRQLRAEVQEADENYQEAIREFDAYKKHTTNLLQKEKELNERLRHLMG